MEAVKKLGLMALIISLTCIIGACGGGDDTELPTLPDPNNQGTGGDPDTSAILGEPDTPFAPMNDQPFNDLRGVAVSSRFVYIADATSVTIYRKNGQGIRRVNSPYGATIQAITTFPEQLDDVTLPEEYSSLSAFAGLPVVLHNPVPFTGYVTVMPANLDTDSTIEDSNNLDLSRLVTFPNGGNNIDPPDVLGISADWLCVECVDMKVDPFGSIMATTKIIDAFDGLDPGGASPPNVGLQVFNRFRDYTIEYGSARDLNDDIEGNPSSIPTFHRAFDNSVGLLGNIAFGNNILTVAGLNIAQYEYHMYTGDVNGGAGNFQDIVGRTRLRLNLNTTPPSYNINPIADDPPFYDQAFGLLPDQIFAAIPGNPSIQGGGQFDPDLTAGGPSGLFVDQGTGLTYMCDPGNDRILVFDAFETDKLSFPGGNIQSLIGDVQELESILTGGGIMEPSEIVVDEFGRTFICDINNLIILPGAALNTVYGEVGGTVRHADLGVPLVGAEINIQDEFGIIQTTQPIVSNINGDYLIPYSIPYGQYMITASKLGYSDDSWIATIVPDERIRVDFNLKPNPTIITGNYLGVVYEYDTQSFLADVIVSVVGTSISTTTDGGGEFKIPNLADGTYQVSFEKQGYETVYMDVVILAGENTYHPNIVLKRSPLL